MNKLIKRAIVFLAPIVVAKVVDKVLGEDDTKKKKRKKINKTACTHVGRISLTSTGYFLSLNGNVEKLFFVVTASCSESATLSFISPVIIARFEYLFT